MYNQKPLLGTLINWAHPLSKGLAGAWLFNEGSGLKTFDIIGRNHGTFGAGTAAPTWVLGKTGLALDFDGINDKVTTSSRIFTVPSARSVSARIYVHDAEPQLYAGRIVNERLNTGWLFGTQDINELVFYQSGSTALMVTSVDNSITLNTWHHVSVTWDGSVTAANVHMYIDGKEVTYDMQQNGVSLSNSDGTGIYIGAHEESEFGEFDGLMSEVYIYKRVLSTSEIWQLDVNPYCWLAQPMGAELMYAAPPVGAIINQFQRSNLGADLYDGVLIT